MPRARRTPKPTDPHATTLPKIKLKQEQIRVADPKVADFVAKVLIKNNMDAREAAKELLPEASAIEAGKMAEGLIAKPPVQRALERNLQAKALDDDAKNVYVERLWEWFLNGDTPKALKAAGILGKAFIREKDEGDKPADLKIKGMGDGIKNMLGEFADELPDESESESEVRE